MSTPKHIYSIRKPGAQLELCSHITYGPCVPIGSRRYLSLVEKSGQLAEQTRVLCTECKQEFVIWNPKEGRES